MLPAMVAVSKQRQGIRAFLIPVLPARSLKDPKEVEMLSRTARLAAAIVIMAGWSFLATPGSVVANSTFECEETPPNECCVPSSECSSGSFCCFFDDPENPLDPKFCGCELEV